MNRPFLAKAKRPPLKLGPRVLNNTDNDAITSPTKASSKAPHLLGSRTSTASSPHPAEEGRATASSSGRLPAAGVRGRGSVQAPGVPVAREGVSVANTKAAAVVEEEDDEEAPIILDEIFRKTGTKPSLYWLPLSEEEV